MALWFLRMDRWINAFRVVGFVDDAPSKRHVEIKGYSVLSDTGRLADLVRKHDIGVLAFAIDEIDSAERERILEQCRSTKLPIIMFPDMLDAIQSYLPIDGADTNHGTIRSSEINGWLNDIDALLAAGDISSAREKIATIQQQVEQYE